MYKQQVSFIKDSPLEDPLLWKSFGILNMIDKI